MVNTRQDTYTISGEKYHGTLHANHHVFSVDWLFLYIVSCWSHKNQSCYKAAHAPIRLSIVVC